MTKDIGMDSVIRRAHITLALALTLVCVGGGTASAATPQAAFAFDAPLTGTATPASPGARDPAPATTELAAELEQSTGLSPSQVTTRSECPAVSPGQARCDAQAVVLRADAQPVHPRPGARATFTQVFPRDHRGIASVAAIGGAAATAPLAHTPAWLQQAYDLTYLSQTGGVGDTVAVIEAGDDPDADSDLATYRSAYGLPACTTANGCFEKVNESGQQGEYPATAQPDWEVESALDVDAVSALCPNCHILLVEAGTSYSTDLDAAVATAVSLGANQVSNSYSLASNTPYAGTWTFPGVAVIASTGDTGYIAGGEGSYPATLPGVTAAGGTNLAPTTTSAPSPRGFTEASWAQATVDGVTDGASSGCDLQETKPAWQTDTGCTGRSYSDVSADADPYTGLDIYESAGGGWQLYGGTSLSSPLIAAYEAVTGVTGTTPQWAYADSHLLTDPTTGMNGLTIETDNDACGLALAYLCNAGVGYDGPTGVGSILGDVVPGAPGVGGPSIGAGWQGAGNTYAQMTTSTTVTLTGGVYPNSLDTTYEWQYGTSTAYGEQTAATDIGSGTAAVGVTDTLTGLTPGTTYDYRLVATNSDGTSYGYNYSFTTAAASDVAPVDTVLPAISGTATEGQTLAVTTGGWNPSPTGYTYQWQRSADGANWTAITGATGSTYTLAAADVGDDIDVVVTAADAWGQTAATATAVGLVASATPVNTGAPAITGSPHQGEVLTVTSTWTPANLTYTYQWQRSPDASTWSNISDATAATYTLGVADEGDSIRVAVTAADAYGATTADSPAIGPIHSNPPVNITVPGVTGTPQRTFTLTAGQGTWSGTGNAYEYQWQSSPDGGVTWSNISDADSSTYKLGVTDEGDEIRVVVTASNVDGLTTQASAATNPVAPDPPGNTIAPTISGTAERSDTLSATAGTWTGPDNSYAYQWQRDCGGGFADVTGATTDSDTLTAADEGCSVRVVVVATNPDAAIAQASQPTATVTADLPVNTTAPALTGTAQRGSTLSASAGTWSGQGNAYSYQWQDSIDGSTWASIPGATATTYTLGVGDEGTELRAVVTATNPDGSATADTADSTLIPAAPPVDSAVPTVSGTAQRTAVLTGTLGTWSGIANTYTEQWQRSADHGVTWTNIAGATAGTYTLGAADEGDIVRLLVTATNPDGTAAAASVATATVVGGAPVATAPPVVTGPAQRAGTLTATAGMWGGLGNTYTYQWDRSTDQGATWTPVTGATGLTDTLGVADEGSQLRLSVTASNPDGTVTAVSSATGVVPAAPPADTAPPSVTGTPQRASTLTGTQGTWTGIGNTYADQWQSSPDGGVTWTAIPGATATTYTPVLADEGNLIRLRVTATNPDAVVTAVSAATIAVAAAAPADTALPAITGTVARGSILTGSPGAWSGAGNSTTDQWQSSPDDGVTWTAITGATGSTYTPTIADEGSELRFAVTVSNPDGTATVASAATLAVPSSPPVDTAVPVITGTAARASTLAVSTGTWSGIGNTYTYQWQRNAGTGFVAISGATNATYVVGVADEGATLRAVVSAANPDGTVTATTAATTVVPSAPPVDTAVPTIAGTAQRGGILNSFQGTWTGIGNAYADQWQRSADQGATWTAIAGATAGSYTLTAADEGDLVRLQVTATNPDGIAVADSAATATVAAAAPSDTSLPTIAGTPTRSAILTSTPGVWSGFANAYLLQWQRSADQGATWTDISGATTSDYTLAVADEGDLVRLQVTASNSDGGAIAASAPTATISAAPAVNTVLPTVTGVAVRGSSLSSAQGTWTGAGNVYTNQWQRSADGGTTWTDIAGATSAAYTVAVSDEGSELRVAVTATNPDGALTVTSVPTSVAAAAPPVSTSAPVVSGILQRTALLTATTGSWNGVGNVYTDQWQRSADQGATWVNIPGATSATYTPVAADEADNLRVLVTGSNLDGTSSAASAATAPIQGAPPVESALPVVSGTVGLGDKLTATSGTWKPDTTGIGYAWQRGTPAGGYQTIPGQTAAAYTLTAADVGESIRVVVTAVNVDGSTTATSAPTAVVLGPPTNTAAPAAPSGTLENTDTLTAAAGTWDEPSATFVYAWMRCPATAAAVTAACTKVATGTTYTLAAADVGSTIAVAVTATSIGGQTTVDGALTAVITGRPLTNLTAPGISGNPQVPDTLGATPGQWSVTPTTTAFTWERCDLDGSSNCVSVGTSGSYTLSSADLGHTIVLQVSVTSPGQTATAVSSALTVQDQPSPQSAAAPTISGSPVRASVLTATAGTWSNSPTQILYQWMRCDASGHNCQPLTGQTAATYTPTHADEGSTVTVTVTAANAAGSAAATAAPAGPIAAALPVSTAAPVIQTDSAIAADGVTLTMGGYRWQATPDTILTTSWQRCDTAGQNCVTIAGATGTSYTLADADVGSTVRAVSIATNADGTVSAASPRTGTVLPPAPRWKTLPILGADPGHVGDVLSITAGVWTGPAVTTDTVQLMRCTNVCQSDGAAGASAYTIAGSDVGAILRVRETAANVSGDTVVWSASYVGPVISTSAGVAVLAGGQVAIRTDQGMTLATAQLAPAPAAMTADIRIAGVTRRRAPGRGPTVTLHRAHGVRGSLTAWVCPVTLNPDGSPRACSARVALRARARLELPASMTGRLRVVVITTRR